MKYKTRFLLFFVAMALFHLAANFAHPVTPTIIQELGLPDYMFGLMLAVMMIANFALSPSWGNINRFISSRQSLLICCVGYAVAQLGFAYSTTQAGILFVRLLAGVFIGGMFVLYGKQYASLCRYAGLDNEAAEVEAAAAEMEAAVKTAGWDGDWFVRAYDAYGNAVGSHTCDEGQIFIEPQGMCVMAGIGTDDGKAVRALDSVRQRLLGKYGVELLAPCYTVYHKELGEITSYPPGYKENGSIFCHNNPWISIAETVVGRGENAFDIYRRTCPVYQEEHSDIRRVEPYVYAQTVAARASYDEGAARNSWLTGTAAWTFVNISQYILGVKPTPAGLRIDPCLPGALEEYSVRRRYRGAAYHIHVVQTGTYSLSVDGENVAGNLIPMKDGKKKYHVEVTV